MRPHDLRRHSATYVSRSGVPIEIVSKVNLRHANLSTTQRYLGTISDVEAIRWIKSLYRLVIGGAQVRAHANLDCLRFGDLKKLAGLLSAGP